MVEKDSKFINEFIEISKYFGQRFDLIQASGGNSSVKDKNRMFIKSSGYSMAEVGNTNGFSILRNDELIKFLFKTKDKKITEKVEQESFRALKKSIINGNAPSIETFTHSLLKKYTIHIHPVACNVVSVDKNSRSIFKNLFSHEIEEENIFYIKYKTPGIALATEIIRTILPSLNKIKTSEYSALFLENHGLICSSDNKDKLINYVETIVSKFEKYLGLNFAKYKLTTKISQALWSHGYDDLVSYYSEDSIINHHIKNMNLAKIETPMNPDQLLYCGESVLVIKKSLKLEMGHYIKKYKTYPRVTIYRKSVYFVAQNILKARESEDVFKSHIYFHSTSSTKRKLSSANIKKLESYNPQKNRLRFWFDYLK